MGGWEKKREGSGILPSQHKWLKALPFLRGTHHPCPRDRCRLGPWREHWVQHPAHVPLTSGVTVGKAPCCMSQLPRLLNGNHEPDSVSLTLGRALQTASFRKAVWAVGFLPPWGQRLDPSPGNQWEALQMRRSEVCPQDLETPAQEIYSLSTLSVPPSPLLLFGWD